MKELRFSRLLLLISSVVLNNILFGQFTDYLSTNPVSFLKSPSVLEREQQAKKYHIRSAALTDYKGNFSGKDTTFASGRDVYTMTFTRSGNILSENWPGQITDYHYDKNDLLCKINYGEDSILLYYDTNKRLAYKRKFSKDTLLWSTVYTYNAGGKLLGYKIYRLKRLNTKIFSADSVYCGSYDWNYDERGRITQVKSDTPYDISKSAVYIYEYAENGNIKITETVSLKFEIVFDAAGNELSWRSFDQVKMFDANYTHDTDGNRLSITHPSNPNEEPKLTYLNKYDRNGLIIEYFEVSTRLPGEVHRWNLSYTFY